MLAVFVDEGEEVEGEGVVGFSDGTIVVYPLDFVVDTFRLVTSMGSGELLEQHEDELFGVNCGNLSLYKQFEIPDFIRMLDGGSTWYRTIYSYVGHP